MNKSIILSALQSQLATIRSEAEAFQTEVYEPNVFAIKESIKEWFTSNVITGFNDLAISNDIITIYPNPGGDYTNRVEFALRNSYDRDKSKQYVRFNCYGADFNSNENYSNDANYLNVAAACAFKFKLIADTMLADWIPAINKVEQSKSKVSGKIWQLENEIRNAEREIAELEKEQYCQTGVEVKLLGYKQFDYKYGDNGKEYMLEDREKSIRLQTGRSKWDYCYIHEFKVINFPKAKHAKVVISYKSSSSDEKSFTLEINKARFNEFIDDVYNWQTKSAAETTATAEERYARATEKATA